MKSLLLAIVACFTTLPLLAQNYRVTVDLRNVLNDRLRVTVHTPPQHAESVTVIFPATIPGTYENQKWWSYVALFKAIDSTGKELVVRRSTDSQFVIQDAKRLKAIYYEVDDTFDAARTQDPIFPPAGTGFMKDSVFILNHAGIVCTIEGQQNIPYQIEIQKPKHLFGSSALPIVRLSDTLNFYATRSYDELIDSPVMYSVPDTATIDVAGVKVLVSVAQHGSTKIAKTYANRLEQICGTIAKFLPKMPVNRYAFLIYSWNGDTNNVYHKMPLYGALEHNYSSFYFLQYSENADILNDVAAHEFLHILIPLNLHSKEIESFDFRNPKMSEHLWLYEGVTEYFANLAFAKDSSVSKEQFIREMRAKMRSTSNLPSDFTFTKFSKNVLEPKNQQLYPIVYTHGAVNAWLLDIVIRSTTDGRKSLLDIVYALSAKYGASRAFDDSELFDAIEAETNSEVREYLDDHIDGSDPLPFEKVLKLIGYNYKSKGTQPKVGFGFRPAFEKMTETSTSLSIIPEGKNSTFEFEDTDVITKVNGVALPDMKRDDYSIFFSDKAGVEAKFTILRNGKEQEITVTSEKSEVPARHIISPVEHPTPEQQKLLEQVLHG